MTYDNEDDSFGSGGMNWGSFLKDATNSGLGIFSAFSKKKPQAQAAPKAAPFNWKPWAAGVGLLIAAGIVWKLAMSGGKGRTA